MNLKKENNSVLLCCGKARCPAITKSETLKNHYHITDDEGGKVTLTRAQLLLIKNAVDELDGG